MDSVVCLKVDKTAVIRMHRCSFEQFKIQAIFWGFKCSNLWNNLSSVGEGKRFSVGGATCFVWCAFIQLCLPFQFRDFGIRGARFRRSPTNCNVAILNAIRSYLRFIFKIGIRVALSIFDYHSIVVRLLLK